MKISRIYHFSVILILIAQGACAQIKESGFDLMLSALLSNSVDQINVNELDSLIGKEDILILDTREKREFEVSHIDGALNVGFDKFQKSKVKNLPKNKPVIVYCSVGYRSEKIGEKLLKMGFEDVRNLRGGIFDWKNSGKSVVDSEGNSTDKVHTYNKEWSRWLWNGEKVYE